MRVIYKIFTAAFFILVFLGIILYAKGYRLNIVDKKLESTGIVAITSYPKAASVYLNGKLTGATDVNLVLEPKLWEVEIKKEGYTTWKKKFTLKAGVVVSLDARLFPKNPSLKPLTSMGVVDVARTGKVGELLLLTEKKESKEEGKFEIYLLKDNKNPFVSKRALVKLIGFDEILEKVETFDLKAFFSSEDQFILEIGERKYLSSFTAQQEPVDVTSSFDQLKQAWEEKKEDQLLNVLKSFPDDFYKIATNSFQIISFSPDETKLLYKSNKNLDLPYFFKKPLEGGNPAEEARRLLKDKYYVYDKKEDKNYLIDVDFKEPPLWYIDSKRLFFVRDLSIISVDYDGENKSVIYSGPFEKKFFEVNSKGNIYILVNLNKEVNPYPDIYELIINN